jgi:hypothetical protein
MPRGVTTHAERDVAVVSRCRDAPESTSRLAPLEQPPAKAVASATKAIRVVIIGESSSP